MIEKTYDHSGSIVFWKCGEESSHYFIRRAVENLGEAFADCLPRPITPTSALKSVLEQHIMPDTKGHNILVRPLKGMDDRAFTVVQEDPALKGIGRYKQVMTAVFYSEDSFDLDPNPPHRQLIFDAYRKRRELMGSTAVGSVLVDVARTLHAIPLREGGGVYWISDNHMPIWESFAKSIEKAGNNKIYALKVEANAEMVRCIGDNLAAQLTSDLKRLEADLQVDEFSESYLATRRKQLEQIRSRANDFESAFDRVLTEIKPLVSSVGDSLATYILMESAYAGDDA